MLLSSDCHQQSSTAVARTSEFARRQPHEMINLFLARKTRDALQVQGYTPELRGPDDYHLTTHWLALSSDDHTVTVEYQHFLEDDGGQLRMQARAKMSQSTSVSAREIDANPGLVQWRDWKPWYSSLNTEEVTFALNAMKLVVRLSLEWEAPSHYSLHVELVTVGRMLLNASAWLPEPTQGGK